MFPIQAAEIYTHVQTTGILCLPHLVFEGNNQCDNR